MSSWDQVLIFDINEVLGISIVQRSIWQWDCHVNTDVPSTYQVVISTTANLCCGQRGVWFRNVYVGVIILKVLIRKLWKSCWWIVLNLHQNRNEFMGSGVDFWYKWRLGYFHRNIYLQPLHVVIQTSRKGRGTFREVAAAQLCGQTRRSTG